MVHEYQQHRCERSPEQIKHLEFRKEFRQKFRHARKNNKTCEKRTISPADSETTEGKIQNEPARQ